MFWNNGIQWNSLIAKCHGGYMNIILDHTDITCKQHGITSIEYHSLYQMSISYFIVIIKSSVNKLTVQYLKTKHNDVKESHVNRDSSLRNA